MIQVAKIIDTGLVTTGLIGSGVGIGVVFGALILGVARNPFLRSPFIYYFILCFTLVLSLIILQVLFGEPMLLDSGCSCYQFNSEFGTIGQRLFPYCTEHGTRNGPGTFFFKEHLVTSTTYWILPAQFTGRYLNF